MHEGFLLIDKPIEWTSHDVINFLRKKLHIKKIGHAGTLDPFASGLLIVGIGRSATKHIDTFKNLPKTYITTGILGAYADTQDKTGTITPVQVNTPPTTQELTDIAHTFLGKQTQIPPMFSAKKIHGTKLYELARQGKTIARTPCDIEVFTLEITRYSYPQFDMTLHVSAGTYIRTIVADIGKKIGTGAYCFELRRTQIGTFSVLNALKIEQITPKILSEHLLPVQITISRANNTVL